MSSITITNEVIEVLSTPEVTQINIEPQLTVIEAYSIAIPNAFIRAENTIFSPSTYITSTNVQDALEEVSLPKWIDYATGFSVIPALTQTIADGDVYEYTYSNGTLYRLVPSGSEQDAFYSAFSGGVLSGLVASKGVTI